MNGNRTHAFIPGVLMVFVGGAYAGCAASHPESTPTPQAATHAQERKEASSAEAIRDLKEGNARFVSGQLQHPRQNPERRAELSRDQDPIAVILGCADSRTSPEVVFDQGLGDLFVVREAGNVVGDHSLGSIEYGVEHLHTALVVVMGHKRCGAVAAARATLAAKSHAEGHIDSIVAGMRPAVEATAGQDAEATCKAHVRNVVQALRTSEPLLRHLVDGGHVKIVGAYYDLETGAVKFLDE